TEGSNSVQIRQTDVAGNVSATTAFTFTLDSIVPTTVGVSLISDTGTSSIDKITNNGALSLSGIEMGASVQYSTDGWTTWSSSFTPTEGSNSIQVRQADVAGNVSAASDFFFTLDTIVPITPGVALTSDTGTFSTDNITKDGRLTLSGIETDALVEYSLDGGNNWATSFTAAQGSNTVQVRQTDLAGNMSDVTTLTFTLDTTKPTTLGVALNSDTGTSNTDKVTQNGALDITGTETGATVEYSMDGGTTWTSSFTPNEGSNSVQVRQTDLAGNVSDATAFTFTLDTAAPTAPGVALASDTGSSNTDKITNNGALNLTSIETGALVQYSLDGGTTWATSFTAAQGSNAVQVRQTDIAGNVSAATAFTFTLDTSAPTAPGVALTSDTGSSNTDKITKDGRLTLSGLETGATVEYSINGGTTWSNSFSASEGNNSVQVRQTDVAGNVSSSSSLTFTLDTTNPNAPSITTYSEPTSGNISIAGLAEAGSTLALSYRSGSSTTLTPLGNVTVGSDGKWSSTPTNNLTNGTFTITVTSTDAAGNVSASTSSLSIIAGTGSVNTLTGTNIDEVIFGYNNSDTLTGGGGEDILIGGRGEDTFSYTNLTDSLLSGFDTIVDYTNIDKIDAPASVNSATLNTSSGNASSLTETSIQSVLTSSTFSAGRTRAFTVTGYSGTFIALNDSTAGFSAANDGLIFLQNYTIGSSNTVSIT
ncbi:MAG: hypothetical protein B0A82_08785, partial [Alkalinema sp. CACIAM 70d]